MHACLGCEGCVTRIVVGVNTRYIALVHDVNIAPQTGRNGAGELIPVEVPDKKARGSAVVGVVYCNDACVLGMRGVLESHCGGLVCYIVFVGECVRA